MNFKISVIMPIYNAEKYLENTLNSVINQSIGFENIELILVDDKSTDNSGNIIKEYSNTYSNIKPIFLEENSGCSGIPRNVGIENATSDYIMFIDCDDEYFPEICDKLYGTLIQENADVVVCNGLNTELDGSNALLKSRNLKKVLYGEEITYFDNVTVWNCIFKKVIILDNDICFVDEFFEDGVFMLEYFIYSKKLVYLNEYIGYHHIQRTGSSSNFSLNACIGMVNSFHICAKILKTNNCDLNRYFKNIIYWIIYQAIVYGNKDEITAILSHLSDFEGKINFNSSINFTYDIINFFILHRCVNIATYIVLFISKMRKSNLVLNIYRKFFLRK